MERRQRRGGLGRGDGLADRDPLEAGQGHDLAAVGRRGFDALQAVEGVELRHLGRLEASVPLGDGDGLAHRDAAGEDPADAEAAEVVAVVEVRDEELQNGLGAPARRRDVLQDRLEERAQILTGAVGRGAGEPDLGVGVDHRELELLLGGVEVDEEVVDLVQHLLRACVGAVDLVDDDDGREAGLEGLAENVAGLRQGAFGCVDEEHHAVDHLEGALHLAAEVAVARRVDDVDLRVPVVDRGVLREDGDAPLALQLVRVHDAVDVLLVGAEDAALLEHGVHQGGLPVVDVGDDGDVPKVHKPSILPRERTCRRPSLTRSRTRNV